MWHGVLRQVLEFPEDDIEVNLVPRKIRTEDHVVPEEPYSQVWTSTVEIIRFASVLFQLDPTVQNCVDCYTSDWVVVNRKYQQYSSSVCIRCPQTPPKGRRTMFWMIQNIRDRGEEKLAVVQNTPRQQFEIDDTPEPTPDYDQVFPSLLLFKTNTL